MSNKNCTLRELAVSKTTEIDYCDDCEKIHLTMGPISLRFSKDHFQRFANDITKAAQQLHSSKLSADFFQIETIIKLHS